MDWRLKDIMVLALRKHALSWGTAASFSFRRSALCSVSVCDLFTGSFVNGVEAFGCGSLMSNLHGWR